MMSKIEQIRAISKAIEADPLTSLKNKYVKVSEYANGIYYDPNYISPISKSAHNLDSKILIVLQDWNATDTLDSQNRTDEHINTGIDLRLVTFKRLSELLKQYVGISIEETYVINVFPYIKIGHASTNIPMADYYYACKKFIVPFINILKPQQIISVGAKPHQVLQKCNIDSVAVPHTGSRGTNNAGGMINVHKKWEQLSFLTR